MTSTRWSGVGRKRRPRVSGRPLRANGRLTPSFGNDESAACELRAGFIRGRHRKKNEEELRTFLSSPRVKVIDMNEETSERYAVILNSLWDLGKPIPTNDLWIASSAMQYGLRVLTTDAHYTDVRQVIVDWFEVS
ncbi:MAG: PIN domain-containing protein [Nitrospirae bacterium]|nr:PIN domain-containing protein [Nitrospirota bacterium]